jgi:MFS family permease
MLTKLLKIQDDELKVFQLHLVFSLLQGIITGVFALNEFVFIKDMGADRFELSLLLQFASIVMLGTMVINEFLKRVKNKVNMLKITALVTHLPLLVLFFFPRQMANYQHSSWYHMVFLGVFLLFYHNQVITLPVINQMLKLHYKGPNFSRLYSYASMANKVTIMIVTFLFGLILDFDNFSFTYIIPFSGILGIYSIYLLARIPQTQDQNPIKIPFLLSLVSSWKNMIEIFKTNRAFLRFEVAFMFYGLGWMIASVILPLYFTQVFEMNHATFGFYKNGYNFLAILLLPFFGSLMNRISVQKFGAITFGSMAIYTSLLALAQYFPQSVSLGSIKLYYSLIAAYTVYSVFAATMALLWFIGSAYFCGKEEVAQYQSIHMSLTGFRAIFSFQMGILLLGVFNFTFTFLIAALLLFVGMGIMLRSR